MFSIYKAATTPQADIDSELNALSTLISDKLGIKPPAITTRMTSILHSIQIHLRYGHALPDNNGDKAIAAIKSMLGERKVSVDTRIGWHKNISKTISFAYSDLPTLITALELKPTAAEKLDIGFMAKC